MSGPKVVRIVTREEILALCRGHLARVDAALGEWIRIGKPTDAEIATAWARRDQLEALIAAERFLDLQKQAPREEQFLRDDLVARQDKLAAEAAAARSRERRGADAAASLLSAIRRSGKPVDPALERALEQAAKGKADAAALAAGFALLSAPDPGRGDEIRAQAALLREPEKQLGYADWLASQPVPASDQALTRLETRLASIALLGDDARIAEWTERLDTTARERDTARRDLLIDSLDVELGRALTAARRLAKQRDEALLLLAELDAAAVVDPVLTATAIATASDSEAIATMTDAARARLETAQANAAAIARRAAVLEGLAGLGYEVTEGMSTAWVDQGRLVLRKAAQPDYGVELAGDSEGGKLQMRPVAFVHDGVGPDAARDIDAETIWCGDVTTLATSIARAGGGLAIERALPIGATPLKRIEAAATKASLVSTTAPLVQARTFDR